MPDAYCHILATANGRAQDPVRRRHDRILNLKSSLFSRGRMGRMMISSSRMSLNPQRRTKIDIIGALFASFMAERYGSQYSPVSAPTKALLGIMTPAGPIRLAPGVFDGDGHIDIAIGSPYQGSGSRYRPRYPRRYLLRSPSHL